MTGLIFARFSRPNARLLFAEHPVISLHDGQPTLMVRFANERHNIIINATAQLWMVRTETTQESRSFRRFSELALLRSDSPLLALSWTLFHVIDADSPLNGLQPDELADTKAGFIVLVTGYDEIAAQTIHARKTYDSRDIRHGHRYADIVGAMDDGRIKVDYGRFHDTELE
jgi:inward rectifier potassium channel